VIGGFLCTAEWLSVRPSPKMSSRQKQETPRHSQSRTHINTDIEDPFSDNKPDLRTRRVRTNIGDAESWRGIDDERSARRRHVKRIAGPNRVGGLYLNPTRLLP
jgi:hypothetical protein